MAQYKGFTFDGINSADYGVVITGASTYSAPERAVEMFDIPGRNGALAIDQGRFANIEITYHCAMADRNQATFAQRLSALRNQLCSRYSYVRLTDDYNADEYRLALYKSGLDADLVIDRGGEFDVVFDCKPQRFLTSGESTYQIGEWGQTITETGDIVTYQGDDLTAVKSLTTTLEPIQSGSGTPSPDNIRPITGRTGQNVFVTGDNSYIANDITVAASGATITRISDTSFRIKGVGSGSYPASKQLLTVFNLEVGETYTCFAYANVNSGKAEMAIRNSSNTILSHSTVSTESGWHSFEFTYDATSGHYLSCFSNFGASGGDVVYSDIHIVKSSEYQHIVREFEDSQGNTLTVYGGEDEIVGGVLTVDSELITFDGSNDEGWTAYTSFNGYYIPIPTMKNGTRQDGVSNMLVNSKTSASGQTNAMWLGVNSNRLFIIGVYETMGSTVADLRTFLSQNPLQVVYPLATPITHQLTPTEVATLIGTNHAWSDAGEVTVEYGTDPYTMVNDTQFASKPLIKVTGYGEVGFGDITITITGTAGVVTYIDCDLMECYRMSGGAITPANQYVTFTGTDFPTIPTGKTRVTSASTISKVEVVPRWWII